MPGYSLLWRERWFQHWKTQYWETEDLSRKSELLCEIFGLSDGTKRLSSLNSLGRGSDACNPNAGEGTFCPEVHFLPVVYKGNLCDGLDVTSILAIVASDDGPCFFFPSLLYMTEWRFWTSLWRTPCNFAYLHCLVNFLSFNFSCKALQFFSLLEWNLSAHTLVMVMCSLEIPTMEHTKHFCQLFRKVPERTATSHRSINFGRSLLLNSWGL